MFTYWKTLAYTLFLSLLLSTSSGYAATNIAGLWLDSSNYYWAFLQGEEDEDGVARIVAVHVASDFLNGDVYLGSLTDTEFTISKLNSSKQLSATVTTDTSFIGTLIEGDDSTEITASLLFTYRGSDYDGVWQIDAENYLMVVNINNGNSDVTGVFDVDIVASDVNTTLYVGSLNEDSVKGIAVKDTSAALQLDFSSSTELSGQYVTVAFPPQIVSFTASKIISVAAATDTASEIVEESESGTLSSATIKAAAAQLGMTEEQLTAILGDPVDLASAAQKLDVSEATLAALLNYPN